MTDEWTLDELKVLFVSDGPHVAELIVCGCGHQEIAFHPFCESVECPGCGTRNPTRFEKLMGFERT